ncbi:MAG: hypothetical protein KDK39_12225 [Leptospiraceae bacterium]|nr:hypothetical protein [Leptospiraceae bacterium]
MTAIGSCQSAPDQKQLQGYFENTSQEDLQKTRWDTGDTTITNEDRLDLFRPHVLNRGGGYIGVGSSQNLSLAAWAGSEWVWLVDFTRIVVAVNKANLAFIQESPTPTEFRYFWQKENDTAALAVIRKHYAQAKDLAFILESFRKSRPYQLRRFRNDDIVTQKYNFALWLYDQKLYDHIRRLAIGGRIIARQGDIRGPITIKSVAHQAALMQVPIRTIYFSNAEEYFDLDGSFRENWLAIQGDKTALVVRTISVDRWDYPWAPGSELSTTRGFHYNIQSLGSYQSWLRSGPPGLRTRMILKTGTIDKANGFSQVSSLYRTTDAQVIP